MFEDRRKIGILISMILSLSLLYFNATAPYASLLTIQKDLNASTTGIHWIVSSILMASAIVMMIGGRLCDTFGGKKISLIGHIFFILGSVVCGFSPDTLSLSLGRGLQGVGAGMIMPSCVSIIINSFPLEQRGRAIGLYQGGGAVMLPLGWLLGGLLTTYVNWESIFFVNVGYGIVVWLLIFIFIPNIPSQINRSINYSHFAFSAVAIASLIFALTQSQDWGVLSYQTLLFILIALIFFILFFYIEKKSKNPLINLTIYKNRVAINAFLICLTVSLVRMSTIFWVIWLQKHFQMSAFISGVALLPATLALLFFSPLGGYLFDKIGPFITISMGLFLGTIGFFMVSLFATDYFLLAIGFLLYGICLSFAFSPSSTLLLNHIPRNQRGEGAGIYQLISQIGNAIGYALMVFLFTIFKTYFVVTELVKQNITSYSISDVKNLIAEEPTTLKATVSTQIYNIVNEAWSFAFVKVMFALALILAMILVVTVIFLRKMRPHEGIE